VEAIILADALVRPKWRSLEYLISDTKSLFELGIIGVAQDMLQAQAAMMEILRCVLLAPAGLAISRNNLR
jgi:hypothetical protein